MTIVGRSCSDAPKFDWREWWPSQSPHHGAVIRAKPTLNRRLLRLLPLLRCFVRFAHIPWKGVKDRRGALLGSEQPIDMVSE